VSSQGLVRATVSIPPWWWAQLVGAPRVHPHEHYANYPQTKDRGVVGASVGCAFFCPQLMKVPMVSSLRPSQDVAETLSKSLRVSELVGAVVGALLPILRSIPTEQEGRVHCPKSIGREVASPASGRFSTVSGHASRRTLQRNPKHKAVTNGSAPHRINGPGACPSSSCASWSWFCSPFIPCSRHTPEGCIEEVHRV
jgi:hypothetical protein